MKVLIVASGNFDDPYNNFAKHQTFVYEQIKELEKLGIIFDYYLIQGKGFKGYLNNIFKLRKKYKSSRYDIVHAHYGISGLLCLIGIIKPLVVTFHGSDVNDKKLNILSSVVALFSSFNIFVSKKLSDKIYFKSTKTTIIPCGVNLDLFYPESKKSARSKLGLDQNASYVLFSSSFNNLIKNYPLANQAIKKSAFKPMCLEIKNQSRDNVRSLLNACDLLLLTSFSEGSPQIIKEAMACNCPIVATNVGDISEIIYGVKECYLAEPVPENISQRIDLILLHKRRSNGRDSIAEYNNIHIASKINYIYKLVTSRKGL